MSKVYVFLANGMEEVECLTVVDLLRRGEVEVVMVSITGTKEVVGSHNITIVADECIEHLSTEERLIKDADLLFLPGGMPGTRNLKSNEMLASMLKEQVNAKKLVGAMCAAPSVLGNLHLLEGKRATCYPGFENELLGATCVTDHVVIDGNVITARGLGYAVELGLTLLSILEGEEVANRVKNSIFA